MKRVLDWRAAARAGCLTATVLLGLPAWAGAADRPALRGGLTGETRGVAPQAGAPLTFFTISQRLAVLRASGRLPEAAAATDTGEVPILKASLGVEPPAAVRPVQRPASGPLGMVALPVPGGELAGKWQAMAARWEGDKRIIAACRTGACLHRGAAKWLEIEAKAETLSGREQLRFVHAALDRSIRYASDFVNNGVPDYWASPLESVEKLGDCEDYAIAKYLMLRGLGHAAEDLKLVVLFQEFSGLHHAVLAVRSGGDWLYLDNQRAEIARAADYRGTRPIAALDETGQSMLAAMPAVSAMTASVAPTLFRGPR
jgi:predicted transglutaminase-like cysteine proteinase